MKKILSVLLLISGLGGALTSQAADFTTQSGFNAIAADMERASVYRGVNPADPLGITGFDMAFEFTQTKIDGSDTVFPKLKFQKGLPLGFDITGYYSWLPTSSLLGADSTAYGAALSYAILDGDDIVALAVRGSYTTLELPGLLTTKTTGLELLVSRQFLLISPYAGIGAMQAESSGGSGPFSHSTTAQRYFFGANLNLKIMDIAFEVDDTDGVQSQSIKFGFRF